VSDRGAGLCKSLWSGAAWSDRDPVNRTCSPRAPRLVKVAVRMTRNQDYSRGLTRPLTRFPVVPLSGGFCGRLARPERPAVDGECLCPPQPQRGARRQRQAASASDRAWTARRAHPWPVRRPLAGRRALRRACRRPLRTLLAMKRRHRPRSGNPHEGNECGCSRCFLVQRRGWWS
jgi:hypothetical protein